MESEKQTEFKFGSEELKKKLTGNYFKPILGHPYNIEIISDEIAERQFEGTWNNDKRLITKYDVKVKIEDTEYLWGVSKKVLTTINNYINETRNFKVILGQQSYDVVPLGLKQ